MRLVLIQVFLVLFCSCSGGSDLDHGKTVHGLGQVYASRHGGFIEVLSIISSAPLFCLDLEFEPRILEFHCSHQLLKMFLHFDVHLRSSL